MNEPLDIPLLDELISRVRKNLMNTGMTQRELAERTGFTEKHISRVLGGYTAGGIRLWDTLLRESDASP